MSPVYEIMQGDWTLYWRLTSKIKRKACYILVLYREVLLLTISSKEPLHRCRYNATSCNTDFASDY